MVSRLPVPRRQPGGLPKPPSFASQQPNYNPIPPVGGGYGGGVDDRFLPQSPELPPIPTLQRKRGGRFPASQMPMSRGFGSNSLATKQPDNQGLAGGMESSPIDRRRML